MRLFIATPINFPLYSLVKATFSKYIEGKWVEEKNLHLTHKFIGEDNPDKYKINLTIPDEEIKIKRLNTFGNKILYLEAKVSDKVNKEINQRFNLTNDKSFKPHITLCRIKNIKDKKFFEELKKWDNLEMILPLEVYLYKSTLTKKGPIYEKIYKY